MTEVLAEGFGFQIHRVSRLGLGDRFRFCGMLLIVGSTLGMDRTGIPKIRSSTQI